MAEHIPRYDGRLPYVCVVRLSQYAEELINGNTPAAAAATEDDFIYQDWAKTRTAYTRRAAKMIHAPDCLARMMFSLIVLAPMMKVILEIVGSTFLRDCG